LLQSALAFSLKAPLLKHQLENLPTGATVAVHVIASNAVGDSPQIGDVMAVVA
jgi:hypothetical protein